jgi:hypothetical protein
MTDESRSARTQGGRSWRLTQGPIIIYGFKSESGVQPAGIRVNTRVVLWNAE